MKIVVTHRANNMVLQNSQMSQMLLPSYNGRNDLWKQKGPQWGQIIFLVTFDFFVLVFFLTSPLYEFLAMGLVKPHCVKCLISAWGQSREWVLHKHKCLWHSCNELYARMGKESISHHGDFINAAIREW